MINPVKHILGDPGVVSRVDKMFVVKVYCKIETSPRLDLTVNFHHEHFIDPTNCPWVSEDGEAGIRRLYIGDKLESNTAINASPRPV